MLNLVIVDDDTRICQSLTGLFTDEGYRVISRNSGEEALVFLRSHDIDVVILDIMLPGMDGLETLRKIRQLSPSVKVIMMSGHADLPTAVEATKLGAVNFFEKPLNPDQILIAVKNIGDQFVLERRLTALESLVDETHQMIGESLVMRRLRETIARTAPTESRVLIVGENGTGKELVARAIHFGSHRKDQAFVTLNCAALPRDLVESELFGYEKGAFTGAVRGKPGRFEKADGGTLFLDEVGDMGLETQAKLLRVLQESEAIRVGGTHSYRFDVRIVSATNKDLKKEIEAGRFREDLFYRLNVFPVQVPPLRERGNDIAMLSSHFLKTLGIHTGKRIKMLAPDAVAVLLSYHWPGNVRELKNMMERLIILFDTETVSKEQVRAALPAGQVASEAAETELPGDDVSLKEMLTQYEKKILQTNFQKTGGNVSQLARLLKIDRANLHRKLKSLGIKS